MRRATQHEAEGAFPGSPRVHSFTFGTTPSFTSEEFRLPPNRLPKVQMHAAHGAPLAPPNPGTPPLQKAGSGRTPGAVSNGFVCGSSGPLRLRQSVEDLQPQGSAACAFSLRSRFAKSTSSLISQGSAPLTHAPEASFLSGSHAQPPNSHLSQAGPLVQQPSEDAGGHSSGSSLGGSQGSSKQPPSIVKSEDEPFVGGFSQPGEASDWEAELAKVKEKAREEAVRRKAAVAAAEARRAPRQITKQEREKVMAIIARSYLKSWLRSHGALVKPPKMHDNVRRVISAWFDLVDADGGGSLDSTELLSALKAAGIPCDDNTILEMISLMDLNSDGEISWEEFENFMCNEMAAGKTLLSGEYVLPSGTSLPFGAMVAKMKRNRMMEDIMEGGERRMKWVSLMNNTKALHDELNLFASAEVTQEEEHHQSEREGRALNALAEMCESERKAAAIAAKVAKEKAESEQMEAEAAAAIISAAEDRALAARLEADAARKTVEREAGERQRQQHERPPLQEHALPPPSPPLARHQPKRSTSGLSGGPAAEAELVNKMCDGQDATPRTFMTEPALPPISPRKPPSPPDTLDTPSQELELPTTTEQSLAGLTSIDSGGEQAVTQSVDVPLSPSSRLGRLSVVVEGDIEGKLDSPDDSPSHGRTSPKSSRGSRSLKPQDNSGSRGTRTKGPEAMNTAGRAAAREAAREAAEREAAHTTTTTPPASTTTSAAPPAPDTATHPAPHPVYAHPHPPLPPHIHPKPPTHHPFRQQHHPQHHSQHSQHQQQHEQQPPLLSPDHSFTKQHTFLSPDHSFTKQHTLLTPDHSHMRLPHELLHGKVGGSGLPGLPLSQLGASQRAGVHTATSIQAALTSRASLSSLPSEYTLPHEDTSASPRHGLAPVRAPPRMSDSTIPQYSSPLRRPPERNRSLPGFGRATQGPPFRQASNSGSDTGDHLAPPAVPQPSPHTLPQLPRTSQLPLAGALNNRQHSSPRSSLPARQLSQQSLTASLYAPKLPTQQC